MLTAKQERFVDEYMASLNGTQAAIRAGYSAKTARAIASENLKKPEIAAELERRMDGRKKRAESQMEMTRNELIKVAFGNIGKLIGKDGTFKDPKEWPPETSAAVQSFRSVTRYRGCGPNRKVVASLVSVKMRDKIKALKLLLVHYGALPPPGRKG